MGLFSLFKKKDEDAQPVSPAGEPSRLFLASEAERARQREIARATAMKIDAIELAMTSDLFNDAPGSPRLVPRQVTLPQAPEPDTLLLHDFPTTLLLTDEEQQDLTPPDPADSALEEAALIYANGDSASARGLLEAQRSSSARPAWWMLFDLYQACGDEAAFDQLSIAYAESFETSPPPWRPPQPAGNTPQAASASECVLPLALDASVESELKRLASLPAVTLDVGGIMDATPEGCALLLDCLRSHRQLALAGGSELAALLRSQCISGAAAAPPAPWLLLLEVLQRLNQAEAFDEVAMDYCITYEISPPQFQAPAAGATAARPAPRASGRFALSGEIIGSLPAFESHVAEYGSLVFDCTHLLRIDYAAANTLLAHLRPLAEAGILIEFRGLSHLVAGLLRLLGVGEVAGLYPHKY